MDNNDTINSNNSNNNTISNDIVSNDDNNINVTFADIYILSHSFFKSPNNKNTYK